MVNRIYKTGISLAIFLSFNIYVRAQLPSKEFLPEQFDSSYYAGFSNHKLIPPQINHQVLIALSHFPELKETAIEFRIRKAHVPLTTMPYMITILKRKVKRKYIITISNKSTEMLSAILLDSLSYNAQIGVLGHELSHVSDFSKKNLWQFIKIAVGHLSGRYVDRFEYNTDLICINHNLGYQLLSWSCDVRHKLGIKQWVGATNVDTYNPKPKERERYMNPSTILNYIHQKKEYSEVK
jgi:hypothetical protein